MMEPIIDPRYRAAYDTARRERAQAFRKSILWALPRRVG